MEETIDDEGMVPVCLGLAGFVVHSDMVKVSLKRWQEGRTEATTPGTLALRVAYHLVGVRASFAVVARFVVLVERVGTPKDSVAVGARIFFIPV